MREMLIERELAVDTVTRQSVVDLSKVKELVELAKQKELIDKQYKAVSQEVKNQMELSGINVLNESGHSIKLSQATRTTVKEEQLIDFLTSKGMLYCLKTGIEPDIDRLRLEVGHSITQDEFKVYVKETGYTKLTIK